MSWYNPASWGVGDAIGNAGAKLLGIGKYDPSNPDRDKMRELGNAEGNMAWQAGQNFGNDRAGNQASLDYLRGQMQGKNSVSAEQLRQGLQQNLATQQSMAAGANPQNAAMAARTAAMNMGQAAYGMSGQQALAGLAERNQAAQNAGQLGLGMSGQDLNQQLGGYGLANNAYGTAFGKPQQTGAGLVMGGLNALGTAMSDRRLKKDVEGGDKAAKDTLAGLKAYKFRYKDEKHGKGEQFGIMSQDLEKVGLGHAVIDTPAGKAVDGAKVATSSLGLVAALGRRVAKLEGSRK